MDNYPTTWFNQQYGLTLIQIKSLIEGAHNFGSVQAKCNKYQGQWTASSLDWFGPEGSDPTSSPDFFMMTGVGVRFVPLRTTQLIASAWTITFPMELC